MNRSTGPDVVVVGGGIVGLSSAIALQERGKRVTLIDPGVGTSRASYGNAGMINRASLFPVASPNIWKNIARYATNRDVSLHIDYKSLVGTVPWFRRFLQRSNEKAWREAAAALDPLTESAWAEHRRLADRAGAQGLIDHCGWLRLFRTQAAFERSALEREILSTRGIACDILTGDDVKKLEPALIRRFERAIFFRDAACIRDPGALVEVYENLFLGTGGSYVHGVVNDLRPSGGEWEATWQGGTIRATQAVLATGAWSHGLTRRLGYRLPLAAERGYHRHFSRGAGPSLLRPVHDAVGGCVIAPMNRGLRVLCGVELAAPSARPHHRLIDHAASQAAGTVTLGAAMELAPWMGSRPSTPDGLPIITLAPRHTGLALAIGHGHIGMSTGPITGQLIADLLTGAQPRISLGAFAIDRF